MKRLAVTAAVLVGLSACFAGASLADTSYRIRIIACAAGAPGSDLVPADTSLYVQSGWITGTPGLVQAAIQNARFTVTDVRNDVSTVYKGTWGPIVPDPDFPGFWRSVWRVDLPPLAAGQSAVIMQTLALAHAQVEIGLPTSDDDQPGLQYRTSWAAGLMTVDFPNPTVCTVTAV